MKKLKHHIQLRELCYPSNLLTLLRFVLVFPILRSLQHPEQRRRSLTLLSAALLTDVIDGPIARARGEVSELGKLIDPVTDKLLLNGSAIMLSRTANFPRWITTALLVRDAVILLGSLIFFRRSTQIAVAQPVGKASTMVFGAALLLHVVGGQRWSRPLLWLAVLLMGASTVVYGRVLLRSFQGAAGKERNQAANEE